MNSTYFGAMLKHFIFVHDMSLIDTLFYLREAINFGEDKGFKNEKKVKALFFALHEVSGHKSSQTPTALLNCAKFHCAICEAQIPF